MLTFQFNIHKTMNTKLHRAYTALYASAHNTKRFNKILLIIRQERDKLSGITYLQAI